jgi:hypothetical protein
LSVAAQSRFNPPPDWPVPPKGWKPPVGWRPYSDWPPVPGNWPIFVPVFPWFARAVVRALILLGLWVVFIVVTPLSWITGPVVVVSDLYFFGCLSVLITGLVQRRRSKRSARAESRAFLASYTGPSVIGYGDLQRATSGSGTYPASE